MSIIHYKQYGQLQEEGDYKDGKKEGTFYKNNCK